jgi:CubicO group peptidase (beta-lactamase class C family)
MFNLAGALLSGPKISLDTPKDDLFASWRKMIKERIFDPLGMNSSYVIPGSLKSLTNIAEGHRNTINVNGAPGSCTPVTRDGNLFFDLNAAPAAGVSCSVGDFNKWLIYLLDRFSNKTTSATTAAKRYLSDANFNKIFQGLTPMDYYNSYAMGTISIFSIHFFYLLTS